MFVTYLFSIENLLVSTIKTYLAGVQHNLTMDNTGLTVWSPKLHQIIKGSQRDEADFTPAHKRLKLPFTRQMILSACALFFNRLSDHLLAIALHAAMCMGLMFLFRKSEYLTGPDRKPKLQGPRTVTLVAENLRFWYGETNYGSDQWQQLPNYLPEFISMYIAGHKGDQFGKGATRFFPSEPHNMHCMCKVLHHYVKLAQLKPGQPVFAGDRVLVTAEMVASYMKRTAQALGIDSKLVAMHSLRVAGLVTLFAADVPDHLKQLAGRWASSLSFIAYARATMQQFGTIAQALNNPNLVTSQHIKMFYAHQDHSPQALQAVALERK
jgi:hypothetical protein